MNPADQKLLEITDAILEGAAEGVGDVLKAGAYLATHPVDALCAVSILVYDASIVALRSEVI